MLQSLKTTETIETTYVKAKRIIQTCTIS